MTTTDDTQTARQARREPLLHLLSRMQRGVLLDAERPLLRAAIETELADGDQAHAEVERSAERLRVAWRRRDHHRAVAEGLRRSIERIAEAPLNVDVWARIGMTLGWTPERAGTEARKRRLHGERTLAQRALDATERAEEAERKLSESETGGHHLLKRAEGAEEWHTAIRRQHNRHRRAVAEALGIDRGAEWPAITEQAATQRADWARCREEAEGAARADVAAARQAEQQAGATLTLRHNQLCDALGTPHLTSWPDLIIAARHLRRDLADAERAQQLDEQQRRRLASILAKPAETPLAELTEYAAQRLTRAGERILDAEQRATAAEQAAERSDADANHNADRCHAERRRADAAEQRARANAAALGDAERERAEARCTLSIRRDELAHALGRDSVSDWGELVNIAATLPDTERQLAKARQLRNDFARQGDRYRNAWRNARARATLMSREVTRRAPLNAEYAERANTAERQLAERTAQCDGWYQRATDAERQLADMTTDRDGWHQAATEQGETLGRRLDAVRDYATSRCTDQHDDIASASWVLHLLDGDSAHTCPDGEPCPDHDQPEPDGAALWAAIRDHAARDTDWWRKQISHLTTLDRRGLL